jgi:hypothetical protein
MESNKEVISKLKFIGKLQKGEKINIRMLYVQQDGVITQFIRTFLQDNRSKTLSFIQDTINKSFDLITYYDKSTRLSERIMSNNLIDDLKRSKNGLVNLKDTYCDDVKFCCDLETLLQLIDAKLIEYNKYDVNSSLPPPPDFEHGFEHNGEHKST